MDKEVCKKCGKELSYISGIGYCKECDIEPLEVEQNETHNISTTNGNTNVKYTINGNKQ